MHLVFFLSDWPSLEKFDHAERVVCFQAVSKKQGAGGSAGFKLWAQAGPGIESTIIGFQKSGLTAPIA